MTGPQDDPQPDEREALARALPWDQTAAGWMQNVEAADAVLAAGLTRRDPDAGLRERVEAALDDILALTGDERVRGAVAYVRAALAGPTPGSDQ